MSEKKDEVCEKRAQTVVENKMHKVGDVLSKVATYTGMALEGTGVVLHEISSVFRNVGWTIQNRKGR